jgi:thymidylate kinase
MNTSDSVTYIALTGVDGSGKSTQLEPLMTHYLDLGHKVAYFHAVEFSLANRISRFFKKEKAFVPGKEKAVIEASFFTLILREKFLFFDMMRFQFWKRRMRLDGYDMILSDRSFYDSLINIKYLNQGRQSKLVEFGFNFLIPLVPKADSVIFFDLKAEDIMSRSRVPEQGREYLEQKLALYQDYSKKFKSIHIDAIQSEKVIFENILENIKVS